MSRGVRCLLWGVALFGFSLVGAIVLHGVFFAALANGRGMSPDAVMPALGAAGCFAALLGLAYYAGIILVIVGIILLVVDGSGPGQSSPGPTSPRYAPPPWREVEDENRRLRQEVERLQRERAAEESGPPPTTPRDPRDGIIPDEQERRRHQ